MKHIRIWNGVNELGERADLVYVVEAGRYYLRVNEHTNDLVSFDEEQIGKLQYNLTDFLMTKQLHPEQIEGGGQE